MTRIDEFVSWLLEQIGHIYVWGAQGQVVTSIKWIQSKEEDPKNANRAIVLYNQRMLDGCKQIKAYDCSGLIMCYLHNLKGFIGYDTNANGLCGMAKKIKRDELKRGDLVFRHNVIKATHVGVYVGKISHNGTSYTHAVIEAMGRDQGVVIREIDASGKSYWNRYGRLALLQEATGPYHATCGGARVNVRTGRGTANPAIGTLSEGDPMLAQPAIDGWCEVACCVKGSLWLGYMSEKYVKEGAK